MFIKKLKISFSLWNSRNHLLTDAGLSICQATVSFKRLWLENNAQQVIFIQERKILASHLVCINISQKF